MNKTTAEDNNQHVPRQINRSVRRASMRDTNNKLLRERERLIEEIKRMHESNTNMSRFLSHLASMVALPESQDIPSGCNRADLMLHRITELVELERKTK